MACETEHIEYFSHYIIVGSEALKLNTVYTSDISAWLLFADDEFFLRARYERTTTGLINEGFGIFVKLFDVSDNEWGGAIRSLMDFCSGLWL
jgi:hypothetical protein